LNIEVHGPPTLLWAPERRIGCTPSRGAWNATLLFYEWMGHARHQMWV